MTENAKKRLKILFVGVLPLWRDRGDAIHFRAIGVAMKERGVFVRFLCLTGPEAPEGVDLGEIRISIIQKRFLRQLTWNLFATIPGLLAVFKNHIDVIYSRPVKGAIVAWLVSKLTGRPLVVEINGLATEDLRLYRPHGPMLLAFSRFWEGLIYRSAKAIVAAPGYAKYLHEEFGIPFKKFCISPLGVNTDLFYPRPVDQCQTKHGFESTPTVVWVGNMAPWQGLKFLVQAAPIVRDSIPGAKFLLVGDGPDRLECEQLVKDLQIEDAVTFTGNVPHESVPEYIGVGNVCVAMFPGDRGKKGTISSMKTISYLACGRPVVTTEMDEMGEIIQKQGAGFMVPPDDPQALADRIIEILTEQQDKWTWRSRQAVNLTLDGGSWDDSSDRIVARLADLAK